MMDFNSSWQSIRVHSGRTAWPKVAAIGIALVIAWQMFNAWLWVPTQGAWQRQATLINKIAEAKLQLERVRLDESYLARETAFSLTGHATEGAHRYQEWLLKRTAEMPGISVLAGPVGAEGGLGSSTRFEISGESELAWLAKFIEELSATPLQHRIVYFKMSEPQSNTVRFTCALEALFLEGAGTMSHWPTAVYDDEAADFMSLVLEREPFKRGYNGPEQEPQLVAHTAPIPEAASEPPIDPLATLKLVGLVSIDGKPQAWLVDSRTNQELHVSQSAKFAFSDQAMQLIHIERDAIEILFGSSPVRWPLGATLRSVLND